jgi:hypothetical protein
MGFLSQWDLSQHTPLGFVPRGGEVEKERDWRHGEWMGEMSE